MGAPGTTEGEWSVVSHFENGVRAGQFTYQPHYHGTAAVAEMKANAHQLAASPDMYDALVKCRKQFSYYEAQHLEKGTPEGDAKAAVNYELKVMCDEVLGKASGA